MTQLESTGELPLLQLVYVSAATRLLVQAELLALLEHSRANNARDDITGVLLYYDGNFVQAIEGPPASLQALKQRIFADPRHHMVLTIIEEPIPERLFGSWSMGFVPGAALAPHTLDGFTRYLEDPASLQLDGVARRYVRATLEMFRGNLR